MKYGETGKKILIFTAFLSNGGISSYAIPLVNELAKDHMVTLLYSGADGDKLSRIDPRVRACSILTPGLLLSLGI